MVSRCVGWSSPGCSNSNSSEVRVCLERWFGIQQRFTPVLQWHGFGIQQRTRSSHCAAARPIVDVQGDTRLDRPKTIAHYNWAIRLPSCCTNFLVAAKLACLYRIVCLHTASHTQTTTTTTTTTTRSVHLPTCHTSISHAHAPHKHLRIRSAHNGSICHSCMCDAQQQQQWQ